VALLKNLLELVESLTILIELGLQLPKLRELRGLIALAWVD
jgi:hypothetical protein